MKSSFALIAIGLILAEVVRHSTADPRPLIPGNRIQCASLIYDVNRSSICFSDRFLTLISSATRIKTSPHFHRVKLASPDLMNYPFAIMSGQGSFQLTVREKNQLRYYLTHGGFLVASAGCSDSQWAQSFRAEFSRCFPGARLMPIPISNPIFHLIYTIPDTHTVHALPGAPPATIYGWSYHNKLVLVFSPDGLNDTRHAHNCCCCGGDEIADAEYINANLLAYAVLH